MEKMKRYIEEYQKIYLKSQKIKKKPYIIYIEGIAFFLLMSLMTYFVGSVLDILYKIDFLIIMFNVIVFSSYAVYKYLTARHYKKITEETHSVMMINSLNYLYAFTIMVSATAFLSFSVFFKAVSLPLAITLAVLSVIAVIGYYFTESKCKRIVVPNTFNIVLNGFFIAVLFYSVTLLIQVNNVVLSFAIVMPIMLTLIVIKRYIEKRFVFHIKRIAIVVLGIFLIVLSFPFTRAFNYLSFQRGEFTFRIIYEELDNPITEFQSEVQGDVILFDDYLIVVDTEEITFFDSDFVVEKTMDNPYVVVYTVGDELYANKRNISNPTIADLYKYDGTDFNLEGSFYVQDVYDKVYLDDNGVQYFMSTDGYIYNDENGLNLELLSAEGRTEYEILAQNDGFISFANTRIFMATPDSYNVDARGNVYNRITYHNGHFVFTYNSIYVARNQSKAHEDDYDTRIFYLMDQEAYFADDTDYQSAVKLEELFRIDKFYYYDGNYYLFGHIAYVNDDDVYSMYVFNDNGELQQEVIIDDDDIAINENYIVYGRDNIKVFSTDSTVNTTYQLTRGYGFFFFTICLVSVFSINDIHLNPKRNKSFKAPKEQE